MPDPLTDDEVSILLDALPDYARIVSIVALDTGMRAGELFNLEWRDVALDIGRITVRRSKNRQFRVLSMTARVKRVLTEQRKLGVIPHVLCRAGGGRLKSIKDVLEDCSAAIGISHVHMHRFRHTFATRLRDKGVPIDRIAQFLGHKTMVMTLRYAQASERQLVEAAKALDDYAYEFDDVGVTAA